MIRIRSIWTISVLVYCVALAGCGITTQYGGPGSGNGNSSVVLAMTDTPPSNVSILSAQVTLTGATLIPGNVSLFSGSTTVELTRLQTDVAYLATATNVPAGNYTGVTLTFANPSLTIENDMATTIGGCATIMICTIAPTATSLSVTVPLTSFTIASSSATGLLIDVNLDDLLSSTLNTLSEDFSVGTTVTPFTPGGIGAPPVGAEDVVGQVGNINASSNTFTLTNATATYSLRVDTTSTFLQFPSSACPTSGFACLQNNQFVSVDIGLQSNGSILARNIVFEDADASDTEIEGMITSTNVGSQQFDIVIQTMSAKVTGLKIGEPITVQYSTSPQTLFDIDLVHADNFQVSTSGFLFAAPADLSVGQQVSIRRNSTLPSGQIKADRVRLRSTRLTGTVGSALPNIFMSTQKMPLLFSLFSGHGINGITAQTLSAPPTIYFEVGTIINSSNILINDPISVRGPLFNVSGARTLITTKVVLR
jgi:hypothetical protein